MVRYSDPLGFPGDKEFGFRHGLAWVIHLGLTLTLGWLMYNARSAGAFNIVWLLPAILVTFVGTYMGEACIEPWLDGANRWMFFRVLLIIDAALAVVPSAVMAWEIFLYTLGSWPGFFGRAIAPIFSLSLFAETMGGALMLIIVSAVYSYFSLRVVLVLLSGEREANLQQVLGNESFGRPASPLERARQDLAIARKRFRERMRPQTRRLKEIETARKIAEFDRKRAEDRARTESEAAARAARAIAKPRLVHRPPELDSLSPERLPLYQLQWPGDSRSAALAQQLGWPATEWILRMRGTPPSDPSELVKGLYALMHIAPALDAEDLTEARERVERLRGHTAVLTADARWADGDPELLDKLPTTVVADVVSRCISRLDRITPRGEMPRPVKRV